MFKRLILEDWHQSLPFISFALSFGVFIVVVIWTLRIKQEKIDRIANLPLENDHQDSSSTRKR